VTDYTPNDLDAERALLGDLLGLPDRVAEVADRLTPEDFFHVAHGRVYAAIRTLHDHGERVDPYTTVDQMRRDGTFGDPRELVAGLMLCGSGAYRRYTDIVVGHAIRRKVIAAAAELIEAAGSSKGDAAGLLDEAHSLFGRIDVPAEHLPVDFYDFDTFLDRGVEHRAPWVVPGMLRRDWRAIVVAGEGVGKSMILRSFALMAAAGVHPFAHAEVRKTRTLLVDLENPDDALVSSCAPIRERARRIGRHEPGRAWLWHRPGGINIRTRADRATFDAILTACKPELVCVGPLYKLYRRDRNESDEQAAEACQQSLDDLRTRHRFALFMEHHAPKGQPGARDMTPYGSSYWLRWPELGFGLEASEQGLRLKRWRGDRLPSNWPVTITRDITWPWVGTWQAGTRFDDGLDEGAP
jgi:hypothetical protein